MLNLQSKIVICRIYFFCCILLSAATTVYSQIVLQPNQKVLQNITENEAQTYQISVRSGEFVRISIEQKETDVKLTVTLPDRQTYEVDNSNDREENERFSYISEISGEMKISVSFVADLANKNVDKSYEIWFESERPATEKDRQRIEAERLYDAANQLRFQKDAAKRQESIAMFQKAAAIFEQSGDEQGAAFSHLATGQVFALLTELVEAQSGYNSAIVIFRRLGFKPQLAKALYNSAPILIRLNDVSQTLARLTEAEAIYRELNRKSEQARILNAFAVIYARQNQPRRAIESQLKALEIVRAEGDFNAEGLILNNLGKGYSDIGEPQKSFEYYEKSLQVLRSIGDTYLEAGALNNLAGYYKSIGQPQKSIEYSEKSYELYEKLGNKQGIAINYNNLADAYDDLNETKKSREFYEKALILNREAKLLEAEAVNLSNLGNLKLKDKDFQSAESYLNQALQIFREIKNKRGESRSLVKLGEIYQKKGDYKKAREYFEQALPILREIEDRDWEGLTLYLLGDTLYLNGEFLKAKELCLQALKIKETTRQPLDEAAILSCLAKIEAASGNLAQAQTYGESSIAKIEIIRTTLSRQDFRSSYFSNKQEIFSLLLNILMERHQREPQKGFDILAWQLSNQTRARNFLDSLDELKNEIRQGVEPELLETESQLFKLINAKDTLRVQALQRNQNEKRTELENELEGLLTELYAVEGKIRAGNPKFNEYIQPAPTNLKTIQTQILDDKTVLLEYALGAQKSFLFLISNNSIEVFDLPGSTEIEQVARNFISVLRTRNLDETRRIQANDKILSGKSSANAADSSIKLSEFLLAPIRNKIVDKTLLIVPSGILQFVPFAALKTLDAQKRERYLIEVNETIILPSVSVLLAMRNNSVLRKRTATNDIAVFADPIFNAEDMRVKTSMRRKTFENTNAKNLSDNKLRAGFSRLMFSRAEAEMIAGFASSGRNLIALDFDANLSKFKSLNLEKFRTLHFATHGTVNSQFPELSSIVLSLVNENGEPQDGLLRLHDIYKLNLNVDTVVLSACETALGKEIKGEGLVGLTRGFMYSGAKSVVASLWQIDDRATAELMKHFYQKLLVEKLRPADALRQAQIKMLSRKTTENPYYWAAFTLQGDFR